MATSTSLHPVNSFEFQAAVPKSCQLQLFPPSSNVILSGPNATPLKQMLKLSVPLKVRPRMKIRLQFLKNGETKSEELQVDEFPSVLWQH
ncbi:unnamed protein product [Heterobilharzia americana]|nr:unnamed protein product [Heterobilharzia americana]CAH8640151.1 unnamed protein product [Heterobilharzia americana]